MPLNTLTRGGQPPAMKSYPAPNISGDTAEKGSVKALSCAPSHPGSKAASVSAPSLGYPDTHQGSHRGRQGPGLSWALRATTHRLCAVSLLRVGLRGRLSSTPGTSIYESLNVPVPQLPHL